MSGEDLLSEDGTSVDWRRLGEISVAAIMLPIISYVVGLVDLVLSAPVLVLEGFGSFVDEFFSELWEIPLSVVETSVPETIAAIESTGVFALPIAVGVVVVAGFVFYRAMVIVIGLLTGVLNLW